MIQARTKHRVFHPNNAHKVLSLSPAVFAAMRTSPEGDQVVLTLTNVTEFKHRVEIPLEEMNGYKGHWQDLLSEKEFSPKKERLSIPLQPYDVLWLVPHTETFPCDDENTPAEFSNNPHCAVLRLGDDPQGHGAYAEFSGTRRPFTTQEQRPIIPLLEL